MTRSNEIAPKDTAPRDLGRYRLYGEIASGGMASVHFGRLVGTAGFTKTVAIKRLHPQFADIQEFVALFLAEARLAARIRHPNVVQPLDVLQIDGEIFLVMEYIDGDSLSRQVKSTLARGERVPLDVGVSILCNVLHGLHAAHEAKNDKGAPLGIVHRDVSPQNILVGIDGVARVIDFGIAKAVDSVQTTRKGELKGKLSYMAPEQLDGRSVTRQADLYAASVVLWEVLTGQRLFDASDQSTILHNVLHQPIDPPSAIAPGLPDDLDAIVLKGLARDPSDRFASAREMALALEERIVLANPSSVGAWVEIVSAESLASRSARIADIEGRPSVRMAEGTEILGSGPPPPTIAVPKGPLVGPEWPVPGIDVAPPDAPPIRAATKRAQGSGTTFLLFVVALALGAFYVVLPVLLKRAYIANAARDGVTLTIDRVDLSLHSIHLGSVVAALPDVPGVTMRVREVDLSLKGLDTKRIGLHDVFASIDGDFPVVRDAIAAWVAAHASRDDSHGTIDAITLDSVKVVWVHPFGEATRFDVENASGTIERHDTHALGDDFDIVAPIVRFTTASTGKMGPWKLRWQRDPRALHASALLDAASGAQGNVVLTEAGLLDVDVRIPHVPLAQLGIPSTAFGRHHDDPMTLEETLKYSTPSVSRVTGELHLILSGVPLPGSATADAEVTAKVDGDPTQPLDVKDGVATLGPLRGKITGSVAVTPASFKAELSWKASGGRCASVDPSVKGTVRFDSRSVDDTEILLAPGAKCGPRVFGP